MMNCSSVLNQKVPLFFKNPQIEKNPKIDWNSVIKRHAKLKNDKAILSTYTQMESLCVLPDNATLPLVFKACARLNAMEMGKTIHLKVKDTDVRDDVRVGTAILDFYCKCSLLEHARNVFDDMPKRDMVSWNAMIYGYAMSGYREEALLLLAEMQKDGLRPNSRTVVALLSACEEDLDSRIGQAVHCYCLRNRILDSDAHVGTALISFYLNFDVMISRLVFDSMVLRNVVSWNAMITGYLDAGDSHKALDLCFLMHKSGFQFDIVTALVVIQACADFGCLEFGKQIHSVVTKFSYMRDLFILNALLNMYSQLGSLNSACKLFESITARDLALWNSMMSAYVKSERHEEAFALFLKMRESGIKEDVTTIMILVSLCPEMLNGWIVGRSLHAHAIKRGMKMDVSLGNTVLGMYNELNCLESTRKVFGLMSDVDVNSYNTLIMAMAAKKFKREAWGLFMLMQESHIKPNAHTVISVLPICEDEDFLNFGRSLHGFAMKRGFETNVSLNTALTDMYMKCNDVSVARELFESCLDRDLISWNAMISGYIECDQTEEALALFNRMISEVKPNSTTITSILSSCTDLSNLPLGKCLHAYAIRREPSSGFNLSVTNALITMYAKCGSMGNAEKIFGLLSTKSIITWNAVITGYGMHGQGEDAVRTFIRMLEEGFEPNGVTFLSLLSACSHSGLVEKGLRLFYAMVNEFNITPEMAHFGCMVDLLGRAGLLEESMNFIKQMPVEPDASVWRALLNACRVHHKTNLANFAFQKLVESEPMNAGNYVLMSNIYAEAGLWSEVMRTRAWLRDNGLRKPPGMSWIVVRDHSHSFGAADTSHPSSEKIYTVLNGLIDCIREIEQLEDLCCALED